MHIKAAFIDKIHYAFDYSLSTLDLYVRVLKFFKYAMLHEVDCNCVNTLSKQRKMIISTKGQQEKDDQR